MKTKILNQQAIAGLMAAGVTMLGALTATAASPALQGRVAIRPLTPSDLKDYSLPTGTQMGSGLNTVGLGQPVYLEALVNIEVPASDILDVSWVFTQKPAASRAEMVASPLGSQVPPYHPDDQDVSRVAGRRMFRPDVTGKYQVTATITTASSGATNVTRTITGATYMGRNTCALCHSGSDVVPDMMTPWSKTGHATFFTRAIDGEASDHYGKNCISCHVVGFDANTNAVNGGFDDIATQLGWQVPLTFTNGNWDAMPAALKNLSNIQCESCHGPGSEHAYSDGILGNISAISVTYEAGNCGQCHDAKTHHKNNAEWSNSKHGAPTRSPTGPGRAGCVACHTGTGFTTAMSGVTPTDPTYNSISCAACHDPHDATNPHQLHGVGPITLMDGITTITNAGNASMCMNCHKSRRDAVSYVETTAGSSHFGPHYSCQADMIAGANAITYGKIIPSTAHGSAIGENCVTCHMQVVPATNPAFTKAGGHTFSMKWEGNATTGPVQLVDACKTCHGPVTTFNFARQDYDEDGVIEGVQDEVEGLLHHLGMLLPPIGDPTVTITASYTKQQLKAAFNYMFVEEDGSMGVHNTSYAVGLLKASIADLTDDADRDGLSDQWEIANFGSISAYDGAGDPDNDGVSNALELAAGTNPMLVDSDADGVNDMAELKAGSDPLNASDKPGLVVKIYTAGELEFASQTGKTYQIQAVSELNTTWENVGAKIPGTGEMITQLVSTRSGDGKAYFRVIEVQP